MAPTWPPPANGYNLVSRSPRRTSTVAAGCGRCDTTDCGPKRARVCSYSPGGQKVNVRLQVAKTEVLARLVPSGGSGENPHLLTPVSLQCTSVLHRLPVTLTLLPPRYQDSRDDMGPAG